MKRGRRRKREGEGEEERSEGRKKREKTIEMTNLIDEERMGLERMGLKFSAWSCPAKLPTKTGNTGGLALKAPLAWAMLDPIFDNS